MKGQEKQTIVRPAFSSEDPSKIVKRCDHIYMNRYCAG
jgi:hypothetical protein